MGFVLFILVALAVAGLVIYHDEIVNYVESKFKSSTTTVKASKKGSKRKKR